MNGNSLCAAGDGKSGLSILDIDVNMLLASELKNFNPDIDRKYQRVINENLEMRYKQIIKKWNEMLEPRTLMFEFDPEADETYHRVVNEDISERYDKVIEKWNEIIKPKLEIMNFNTEEYDTYQKIKNDEIDEKYNTIMEKWNEIIDDFMQIPVGHEIMNFDADLHMEYGRLMENMENIKFNSVIKKWNIMTGVELEKRIDIGKYEEEKRMNNFFESERNIGIKFMDAIHKNPNIKATYWNQFIIRKLNPYMYDLIYPYLTVGGSIIESNILRSSKETIIEYMYLIKTGLFVMNDVGIPVRIF